MGFSLPDAFKQPGSRLFDFPEMITDPRNRLHGLRVSETNTQKYASFGNLFVRGSQEKIAWVNIPSHEADGVYLMHIAVTMLSAEGGDFDQEDRIHAEILSIGVDPDTDKDIPPGPGGVTGLGSVNPQGISTYIGPIKGDTVKFRLVCKGDDLVGASYFILELGMKGAETP